ncbi:hypothetical protein BH10PSE7_BH10PSE7_07710 [soil metagenome]
MAKRPQSHRTAWSKDILKQFKGLAGQAPVSQIAKTLQRTEAAIRKRATDIGLSLRVQKAAKKKSPAKKKAARKAR